MNKDLIKNYKKRSKNYIIIKNIIQNTSEVTMLILTSLKKILDLEKKYKFLRDENPPLKVGYKPSKIFETKTSRSDVIIANAFSEKIRLIWEKNIQLFEY